MQLRAKSEAALQAGATALLLKLNRYKEGLTELLLKHDIDPISAGSQGDGTGTIQANPPHPQPHSHSHSQPHRIRNSTLNAQDDSDRSIESLRKSVIRVPVVGSVLAAVAFEDRDHASSHGSHPSILDRDGPSNVVAAHIGWFIESFGYPAWFVAAAAVITFGLLCAARSVS
jgi:hypothetical protein